MVRAILPQGPPRIGEAQRAESMSVGGWVFPLGDSFLGGGASDGGFQGGKTRRGRRGTPYANGTDGMIAEAVAELEVSAVF